MNTPRKISARMMPTISTSCCIFFGTENRAMITTKTKRLSIERLYSVSQPTTNCPACSASPSSSMSSAKMSASTT